MGKKCTENSSNSSSDSECNCYKCYRKYKHKYSCNDIICKPPKKDCKKKSKPESVCSTDSETKIGRAHV